MVTTRQRTSAAARRRGKNDDEKVDEKKNQKNKKGGEKAKTTTSTRRRRLSRRLGNEQPAYEIETQKSLQRDHDEHFEEEHEPFFFGPYAMPCPEERYRKWLCADCPTCKKTDAPLYAIHNTYILSGYRTRNTFWDAFRSIFKKHNETTNIWTHLIGMIFFFTFLVNVKEPERVQMIPETWVTGASAERVLGLQMTQRWRDKVIMVDEGLREARKSFVREKISRMSDSYTNNNNNKDDEKAHSSSSISFAA